MSGDKSFSRGSKLLQEGFVHLVPLALIVIVVVGFLLISSKPSVDSQKETGLVLSRDEENDDQDSDLEDTDDSVDQEDGDDDNNDAGENENEAEDETEVEDEIEDEIEELEFEDKNKVQNRLKVEDNNKNEKEEGDEEESEDLITEDTEQRVEIRRENGKIKLKIKTKTAEGEETEEEIEASDPANVASLSLKLKDKEIKLKLRTENGRVVFVQEVNGDEALVFTDLPITIDSEKNKVTVKTFSGNAINLSEFPAEIMQKLLSSLNFENINSLELKARTREGREKVVYHANVENKVKLLGLFDLKVEMESEIDIETGEQEIVVQPWYLKYLGFLFTS